ncbi:MAG: mannose-6-phosphate isomerase-like protein (cupin superfamily) [Alphaproteobacteria bacterium]|jgi:mannose-6-phosphate isomerase-like protein (cupin superfamily)
MDVPKISVEEMESKYVAREATSSGSDLAFLDQRLPGYQREIINMIGMGVTENTKDASLEPKISTPAYGFAVTYNRATNGNGAALHAHLTEEVFIPIRGEWQIYWLEGEDERSVILGPGDIVNMPTGIYRGFRCASEEPDALLIGITGGPDSGHVAWHPSIVEAARGTGLEIDDDGNLREIDS